MKPEPRRLASPRTGSPMELNAAPMANRQDPAFLRLPLAVRRTIYGVLGMTRQCPVYLSSRRPTKKLTRARQPGDFWDTSHGCEEPSPWLCWHKQCLIGDADMFPSDSRLCGCERFPFELTHISRQVREEVLDAFFETNLFVLHSKDLNLHTFTDFPLFTDVQTRHLARMTRLVIRLSAWSCPWGHDQTLSRAFMDATVRDEYCTLCGTRPISSQSHLDPRSMRLLEAWDGLCRRLGSGRRPGKTDLTLICDIDGIEDGSLASRVVEPLTKYLPLLRSCTIRLGSNPAAKHLAAVARDTALRLTGQTHVPLATKPFPFAKLPWELKLSVLRHFYRANFDRVVVVNGRLVRGLATVDNPWRRCFGWPVLVDWTKRCCFECTETRLDCCCPTEFASFAPKCTCSGEDPMALFLVDRDTRLVAIEAFYSTVHFTICHSNLAASLDFLPDAALPYIRKLTLRLTSPHCANWSRSLAHVLSVVDYDFQTPSHHLGGKFREMPSAPCESRRIKPVPGEMSRETFSSVLSLLLSSGTTPLHLTFDVRDACPELLKTHWEPCGHKAYFGFDSTTSQYTRKGIIGGKILTEAEWLEKEEEPYEKWRMTRIKGEPWYEQRVHEHDAPDTIFPFVYYFSYDFAVAVKEAFEKENCMRDLGSLRFQLWNWFDWLDTHLERGVLEGWLVPKDSIDVPGEMEEM
ncbi:hypothetical protein B0T14DRAFT_570376 [Immersiella caudata]|uniref:Uncharacterized protein n=1 Tax=Immersiella caudata TaxID=314043 RepID=A0AA39WFG5_9PEZI|nr:hypothetical protein B0T14DRAFT_570376 [Immersiella caudata]